MSESALRLLSEEEQKPKFVISDIHFPSTYAGKIGHVVAHPQPEPEPAKYWARMHEAWLATAFLPDFLDPGALVHSHGVVHVTIPKLAAVGLGLQVEVNEAAEKYSEKYYYIAPRQRLAGTWLSHEAAQYVADYRNTLEPETAAETADLVADSAAIVEKEVLGLIRSLASVLSRSGQSAQYAIGTSGRFTSAVGKAILFRIPLDLFASLDFLNTLYRDFTEAVAVGKLLTDEWRIELTTGGDATLLALPTRRKNDVPKPGPNWVRTEAISVGDLRKR